MRRDWLYVGVIWIVLCAVGVYAVGTWSMLPEGYTREAEVVNHTYVVLLYMAVPVFAFTVTMLGYSAVRFRSDGRPDEDGPHLQASRPVVTTWLVITSALCVLSIIYPGFTGLVDIRGEQSADTVIEVVSQRWSWEIIYENGVVVGQNPGDVMVVPNETRMRFDVTSTDVIHSFWVPAFGMKIDAVPGRTTQMFISTERTGDYETDHKLRIQCAELCGLGHAEMALPVRVVEKAEYEAWLDEMAEKQAAEQADSGATDDTAATDDGATDEDEGA